MLEVTLWYLAITSLFCEIITLSDLVGLLLKQSNVLCLPGVESCDVPLLSPC